MSKYLWKIGGEAGFGIMTSGLVFSKLAIRAGYHIFDYAEYPSLIRGGHNTYEVVVSDEEVHTTKQPVDMLVCLNKDTYVLHKHRLHAKSIVVYDQDEFQIEEPTIKLHVPFKAILKELKGPSMMGNTTALGVSIGLLGGDIAALFTMIEEQFARKGQEIVDYNKQFVQKGYDYVTEHYKEHISTVLAKRSDKTKLVLSGNESYSLSAVAADSKFYAAYPMTPTSNVLSILAAWQTTTGMVVRHAEDEISVINTALGASHAGVRSSVGTSGGGFALMVEAVSYAGVAEIPVVIFLGQRPGPATGMPTWTEQGDLLFACHAGHGEFPKIVLAAGDINEMSDLTLKAFDMADVYQLPVIIMGDKMVCESHKSMYQEELTSRFANYHPNRGKTVRQPSETPYLRYKLSEDGISERLIPGAKGTYYQANSYEHIEDSHTSEDDLARKEQVVKRATKWDTYLTNDFILPAVYGNMDDSSIVFVSWGSNKGAILEARKELEKEGIKTAYLHFTHVYPLHREEVKKMFPEGKRYILVENNSTGQLAKLLAMEVGVQIHDKILKFDGRPIWYEDIISYMLNK